MIKLGLTFGGDAEILKPKSLRQQWMNEIKKMWKRFANNK